MKKLIMTILCVMAVALTPSFAQGINDNGDNIIGEYLTDRGGHKSKVRVTKNADGTYNAQVFWVENPNDKNGNKRKAVEIVADNVSFCGSKNESTGGSTFTRDDSFMNAQPAPSYSTADEGDFKEIPEDDLPF